MILIHLYISAILLGFLVKVEFQIDQLILKHPYRFGKTFIRFKHWIYNFSRLWTWGVICIQYLKYDLPKAALLIVISVTGISFFFRFWHDWLYQREIVINFEKDSYKGFWDSFIISFHRDSKTPIEKENSFWDKHLPDTSDNRLLCFQIFVLITIIQLIFKLY